MIDDSSTTSFKLIEFNARRLARKTEAARVEISQAGHTHWLWMSKSDIRKNIKIYGADPELIKALNFYKNKIFKE